MAVKSLKEFIKSKYEARPRLKQYYGSFEKYRTHYIATKGIGDWLESLRGQSLSRQFVDSSLSRVFIFECNRAPSEIPGILVSLARQYEIDLPVVEGILTKEYWARQAEKFGFYGPAKGVAA
ncbi:hypothetical protein [Marinobacter shengliensis]|uniref:hypothetical protein n=1 Tax=Marinobacter shengliensis TaxID=1389223 RepID=UPI001109F580|nr:hypothetical protein [Marinobacter shengliensis]